MQYFSEIFSGGNRHNHVYVGRNRSFRTTEQLFAYSAISMLRRDVQLVDFKIFRSASINRSVFFRLRIVPQQISENQISFRSNKNSLIFEVLRIIATIAVTGIFLLPFLGKRNQPSCNAFRKRHFLYGHIFLRQITFFFWYHRTDNERKQVDAPACKVQYAPPLLCSTFTALCACVPCTCIVSRIFPIASQNFALSLPHFTVSHFLLRLALFQRPFPIKTALHFLSSCVLCPMSRFLSCPVSHILPCLTLLPRDLLQNRFRSRKLPAQYALAAPAKSACKVRQTVFL